MSYDDWKTHNPDDDRGEFCGFVAADDLRKLAAALDLKAKVDAEGVVVTRPASNSEAK